MIEAGGSYKGGCLCGAVRYEADGEPQYSGYCFCTDCQKSSGSAFIPFMGFSSGLIRFSGRTLQAFSTSIRGTEAVRNFCTVCGSLVFGGKVGEDDSHTIYAGTLDDPSRFRPQIAIFAANRPAWVIIPEHVKAFDAMPG